jgi:nucleoside-diphosphate-sugar epimerase
VASQGTCVAITGAAGFIGRALVRRFESDGCAVRPIVRRDFESGSVDRLVDGADVVVHAAGATRAPTTARLVASNVALTARVIDAARRGGVGRLVFISSQAAAGPSPSLDKAVTEDAMPSPIEPYGRTKLDAERLVRDSGLSFAIVRPAAVYGPYDRDFLPMFRLAARGIAIHPGNRDQWISIVHVDDVARGVALASAHADAVQRTYFLANDTPVRWGELFAAAGQSSGRTVRGDIEIPLWMMKMAAIAGDVVGLMSGRASLLTSRKVALAAPQFWTCDASSIRRELGFTPAIQLDRGLTETHDWYRANRWL